MQLSVVQINFLDYLNVLFVICNNSVFKASRKCFCFSSWYLKQSITWICQHSWTGSTFLLMYFYFPMSFRICCFSDLQCIFLHTCTFAGEHILPSGSTILTCMNNERNLTNWEVGCSSVLQKHWLSNGCIWGSRCRFNEKLIIHHKPLSSGSIYITMYTVAPSSSHWFIKRNAWLRQKSRWYPDSYVSRKQFKLFLLAINSSFGGKPDVCTL